MSKHHKPIVKQLKQNEQLITSTHSKSLGHPTTASQHFYSGPVRPHTATGSSSLSHQNIHCQQSGNGAEVYELPLKIRTVPCLTFSLHGELFLYHKKEFKFFCDTL